MRTTLLSVCGAILLAVLLQATRPAPAAQTGAIVALAAPAQAYVGEKVSVRGMAALDGERTMARRFHVCDAGTATCRTTGWGVVEGPGAWSGFAGDVLLGVPATVRIEWSLYGDWGADARRAVARYAMEVEVRDAPR